MISGAAQADVALVMVPADGNFVTAIQRGNHKAGEIQGQTRQHSRLINLLGVKQLLIGVNKMDCDTAGYKKDRYDEISAEMINMLQKVGWKKEFILQSTPILPISGWMGDNLLKKSTNMSWWNGQDIVVQDQKKGTEKLHIDTVQDALNDMARPPVRPTDAAMRLPVSGIYKIKGVGDVIAGRVEQGMVKPGEEVPCFALFSRDVPRCDSGIVTMSYDVVEQGYISELSFWQDASKSVGISKWVAQTARNSNPRR